ncbi:MAG TPA: hypothetical protein DEP84_25630 [Chloroflexi bacterium]|nr:hypothetical protein [Chloroflexota bacterium]
MSSPSYGSDRVNFNLRSMLLWTALTMLVIWWAVFAMGNSDPLWFWPFFSERPTEIVVYHDGTEMTIRPGEPGYEAITAAVNAQIGRPRGYERDTGMSAGTEADARSKYVSVELRYGKPVVIHSNTGIGRPSRLFIPITGRHSEGNLVFLGTDRDFLIGALTLRDRSRLDRELRDLGLLK